MTHCNLQMGSPIADYIESTVVGFESFPLFPKEINSLYFVVLISFISMGFILGNCIQCTKSAIKVLCNCCLARSDVIMHLKVGMIWRNERRRSVLRELSMKRTGFYRQPSHTKVTPGCQGDRLFEENLFLFLSSQERRMSSLNPRMANKVKFVCHWMLKSWRLLRWAHFAFFYFLGCRIWKENWSRI